MGEEGFGDTCICMAESPPCSPETIETVNQLYPNTKQKIQSVGKKCFCIKKKAHVPYLQLKIPHAATKTRHSQINK